MAKESDQRGESAGSGSSKPRDGASARTSKGTLSKATPPAGGGAQKAPTKKVRTRNTAQKNAAQKNTAQRPADIGESPVSAAKSTTETTWTPEAEASESPETPGAAATRKASAPAGATKSQGAATANPSQEQAGAAKPDTTSATADVAVNNQNNRQDTEDMTDDKTQEKIADYEQKKLQVNQQRRFEAERVVQQNAAIAAGVGVIPVPAVDVAGLAVVQLRMLAKLADKYEVMYSGNVGRTLVSTLLGVLVPISLKGTTYGFLRAVPVFGPLLGFLTLPGFAWAATYAVGTVFIDSFEQDEDLENIDVEKAKEKVKRVFDKVSAKANDEAATAGAAKTA